MREKEKKREREREMALLTVRNYVALVMACLP